MDFYCDVVKRNVHVWLGCTKTRNPGIGTVLQWRPPNVQIFSINPPLTKQEESARERALCQLTECF